MKSSLISAHKRMLGTSMELLRYDNTNEYLHHVFMQEIRKILILFGKKKIPLV